MSEDERNSGIVKARIFDNMGMIQEYSAGRIAGKLDISEAEAQEHLEEMAEDGRIRKREKDGRTLFVRFG